MCRAAGGPLWGNKVASYEIISQPDRPLQQLRQEFASFGQTYAWERPAARPGPSNERTRTLGATSVSLSELSIFPNPTQASILLCLDANPGGGSAGGRGRRPQHKPWDGIEGSRAGSDRGLRTLSLYLLLESKGTSRASWTALTFWRATCTASGRFHSSRPSRGRLGWGIELAALGMTSTLDAGAGPT